MAKRLTALKVQKLAAKGVKGRTADGTITGLYLQVTAPGRASWLLRYQHDGAEHFLGLGAYPTFSLREAHERARKQRQLLADKINPLEHRRSTRDAERRDALARITFKEAIPKFLAGHADLWRSSKHRRQWEASLHSYAGALMDRPVRAIDTSVVNDALTEHWTRIPATMARVRGRVQRVCQWIQDGMPLPNTNGKNKENQPSLPWQSIQEFMEELRKQDGVAARALEFTILTGARTGMTILAHRNEIDFNAKVWTVPAAHMKTGHKLRIPLSTRAMEILQNLPTEDGGFVFIGGSKGGGLGETAMRTCLKGLHAARKSNGLDPWIDPKSGRLAVIHGFRATFKTWCEESQHVETAVVEAALAHKKGDRVEAAYSRGDLFTKRTKLMQDWSDSCASKPADVISYPREAAR
jgi:integrase